jgi:hypothetical protein
VGNDRSPTRQRRVEISGGTAQVKYKITILKDKTIPVKYKITNFNIMSFKLLVKLIYLI